MAMEGDLTWGSEHTMQCTDDVLWNCAPETCIILLTNVTTINLIKRRKTQITQFKNGKYIVITMYDARWVPEISGEHFVKYVIV